MYLVYRKKGEEQGCVGVRENRERYNGDPVPESVEDDGALVEFVTGVEQLGSNHRGVCEGGGLAANFFAVDQDVAAMSSAVTQAPRDTQNNQKEHIFSIDKSQS